MPAYAIVRSGGKQYRVREGDTIDVERLPAAEGERVELPEVLLLAEDGQVTVGTPTVPDVKVVTEVVSHGRGRKVTVFKYKAKTRYRKKTGHRQAFTRLAVQAIQVGEEKKPVRRRRARKAAEEQPALSETTAEEPAVTETLAEEPAVGEAAAEEPPVSEAVAEEPAVSETTAEEPAPETEAKKKPAPRRRRKTTDTKSTGE